MNQIMVPENGQIHFQGQEDTTRASLLAFECQELQSPSAIQITSFWIT
jgi:hypothetical protein